MSKSAKKAADQAEREKVHKRYSNRREPDVIYPAKKQVDFYDADIHQRVAVYIRVSTDNLGQETSYELQKNYYEEFVLKHPNWKLVKIYADKGISGTSTKHRVELNQMLADSRAGKIDLIITKSVSRLARNTVDCITMVRNLAELRNPVGVFFESECIFSLNEDTNMPLSFLASIAENESRIRSRSMEVSLAQRLNGGLPLTPKLLGYSHDTDGKLVINPDEAPTVKLIFYMYLSGYSSSHIAKTLEALGKRTFLGNSKWTSGTVIQVLRNERHCGDVLTKKTFTPDVISHKSKKTRGERKQSLYKGEHEAIVSRDDYIAVQHMINNAKYGGKSILPELRVIESGVLKGFVTISPKWAGFKAADYLQASMSVYTDDTYYGQPAEGDATFEVEAGDFDLRGFEVTNASLFDANKRPYVLFQSKTIKFNTDCVRQFGKDSKVELLIHPGLRKFAVRRASKDSRQCVQWSRPDDGKYYAKEIPCTAFGGTLFGSRETPVWCMIYDSLDYKNEADIFANQMKHVRPLKPYEIFMANIEAGNEQQLVIKRLVESYSLSIGPTKAYGVICAVATLERIYTKYGYHVLDRTLRLCVGTWEGDIDSLGANVLAGVARMIVAFGDQLRDETFKEMVGFMSVRQLSRIAKERGAGSLCYAEAMLVAYNRKCKYTLRMSKLHSGKVAAEDDFVEENEEPLADDPVLVG